MVDEDKQMTGVVDINSGTIQGGYENGVYVFKGIPFAKAPVGDLRWVAPEKPELWQNVKKTTNYGPACPQPEAPKYGPQDEDCLYLNVWTPAEKTDEELPVMFWIYGGAFIAGSTNYDDYDGKNLADKGVVVVTSNYRLGPLGFLVHPGGAVGNYGLMDQRAGLEWVQENIEKFGGDPDNVTIFGESAGGMSTTMQMLSQDEEKLFHKVISESGTPMVTPYAFPYNTGLSEEQAADEGERYGQVLGCEDLACMRDKSAAELIEKANLGMPLFPERDKDFEFTPNFNGVVLPSENPINLYRDGMVQNVPLLLGTNLNEGTAFMEEGVTVDQYKEWIERNTGEYADQVFKMFPANNDEEVNKAFADLFTVLLFAQPARFVAENLEQHTAPVYLYQFTRQPDMEEVKLLGAFHGIEIPYVFGNLKQNQGYDEKDFKLSDQIMDYWVNFAKTGDPNGEGLPNWPVYSKEKDENLELGDEIKINTGLFKQACDLFDEMLLEKNK